MIQRALGGVLFIDEAYSLVNSADRQEVIATIVKEMEDRREDLIVILRDMTGRCGSSLTLTLDLGAG